MAIYYVTAEVVNLCLFTVRATSEEEAIELVKNGSIYRSSVLDALAIDVVNVEEESD